MAQTASPIPIPESDLANGAEPAEARNHDLSPPTGVRTRLPDERPGINFKFIVGGHEGYLVVGLYPNGQPGEIFVTMAKEGSTVSGLMNSLAQAVSIGLQYGIPLKLFCEKFSFTRFEPSGWTGNPAIPRATSIPDYIFRWLHQKFFGQDVPPNQGSELLSVCVPETEPPANGTTTPVHPLTGASDATSCKLCGSLMRRNGSCHACDTCGWTSGCG